MRTTGLALLLVLFLGCAAEPAKRPLVPLAHVSSEQGARDLGRALQEAGIPTELVATSEMDPEELPDWIEPEEGSWLVLGKEEDRERANQVVNARHAERRKRAAPAAEPLALGDRRDLDAEEIRKIQGELARRRIVDQAVRWDRSRHSEMAKVDADNTAYLKGVITDVGWIDVERFGRPAADTAFLLVQHSGDLSLMLGALPEIEKDVRAGRADGENFALLYDRTQLISGGMQRYGSQIIENEKGDLVVHKLEDPDGVDARRKALGLVPLRDYLARFGRAVEIER